MITSPSGEPGGTPDGDPTRIRPRDDDETRRGIARENECAAFLADRGYQLKQNPSRPEIADARADAGDSGDPGTDPDYLLEGRVFDCYSPNANKSVRGVWDVVVEKVIEREQTQRVVVDLEDWGGDLSALRRQFQTWPIEGLKEVKVITRDGDILQLFPDETRD